MQKKDLQEYRRLCDELRDLSRRVKKQPYLRQLQAEKLAEKTRQRRALEVSISQIPNSLLRLSIRLHYIDGLSWPATAARISAAGKQNFTAGCLRQISERYFA